jgi:hypothetical protein
MTRTSGPSTSRRLLLATLLFTLAVGQALADTGTDVRLARQAARQAALTAERPSPGVILDGAPRQPTSAVRGEVVPPVSRASRAVRSAGLRSLVTITEEAGMAVPRGGDDIIVDRSADFEGSAYLQIASDGAYYGAVADAGDVQVYRSLDKGESWTLWSTLADPSATIVFLNAFLIAEGDADRMFVAYSASVAVGTAEMRVAHADLGVASPTWTVVTALATPGVSHGHNWRFDLATDVGLYPDYFVYLVAEGDDGDGTDIWFARSVDQGSSFEPGYRIAEGGVGTITDRTGPTIAFGAGDYLHVCYSSTRSDGGLRR